MAGVMFTQVWVNHSHFLSALLECGGKDLRRVRALAQGSPPGCLGGGELGGKRERGAMFVLPEYQP